MRGQLPGSPAPSEKKATDSRRLNAPGELELLFDKEHTCPVCNNTFTSKQVREGKAQLDGRDIDLRPKFLNIDVMKYRVVECPVCGYAGIAKSFSKISDNDARLLREKRLRYDTDAKSEESAREYADAYRYYKSAMRCALIKSAKSSQRGITALYTAWLLRGWREKMREDGYTVAPSEVMGIAEERKLLKYALRNLREAERSENFPINGMEDSAFEYLVAALCYEQDLLDDAANYLSLASEVGIMKPNLGRMADELRREIREKRLK